MSDITAKLCARLERDGKGARRFELFFHRLDGASPSVAVGLAQYAYRARATRGGHTRSTMFSASWGTGSSCTATVRSPTTGP